MLKDDPQLAKTPEGTMLKQVVDHYRGSRFVNTQSVQVLLGLAGVDAVYDAAYAWYYGQNWHWQFDRKVEEESPARFFDVIALERSRWKLRYRFAGSTLALSEFHPSHRQNQLIYR